MGIPQSNTNSDIGTDEEAQLQDVDERSNQIRSAASSNKDKKDNKPSPLLKNLLNKNSMDSKKPYEDKFMSPNPKQRQGSDNQQQPLLSLQKSPLEKSVSMFEILSQNRINANQVQQHGQYSAKKNQSNNSSPSQPQNVVRMPNDKLYKTKQKEVRVQKRIFIEIEPPKPEQLQPQLISQQQQHIQLIAEPNQVKSSEEIAKPQEENKVQDPIHQINQQKNVCEEKPNNSQKIMIEPTNSNQVQKDIDVPSSQLILSDSKASVSQNNQEEHNNQIASLKVQQPPKQPYAVRPQNAQLQFNFNESPQVKSQRDGETVEENKEILKSPFKTVAQSQQTVNQHYSKLASQNQQKLLIDISEPNRVNSDKLQTLLSKNQEAGSEVKQEYHQDSAQIELLANIMKKTTPLESDQNLNQQPFIQLNVKDQQEESKEDSLLTKFGGETKLNAFLEKLIDSLTKDANFDQTHENFKKSNSLKKYFSQENSVLNLAKALFECDNLNQISEIKEIINRFGLSEDLFECFYKDHFSKHLKTMKVNIKIVQQVLKKMNSMREEIVCLNVVLSTEKNTIQEQQNTLIQKIPQRVQSTQIIVQSEVQDQAIIQKCTMIMSVQQEQKENNKQDANILISQQAAEESLFEKFGGEEKCRLLVQKLQSAVLGSQELCPYHQKQVTDPSQDEILKEKMLQYFKYLLGGSKFWLGRSMKESHQHLRISEEHFDIFYKIFTTQLKTIKVPIKIMQTLIKKVNELRSEIVYSETEVLQEQSQSVCLLKVLGEEAGIQKILALTFQMIKNESPSLINCFVEKSTNMFVQKYSFFILANIDEKYHWMAKDMIDGIRNTGIPSERYIEILQYIKIACQQLQILEQASDMLISNLYELREDICSQMQRTGSILDQLDTSQKFEKLIEQFFISLSRSVELKIQGAYQKLEERTPLIQRISKIIVSKSDDELDIDVEIYQNLSINSSLPIYIAGDCFRDTLMDCGVDKESAELARKAFISLRENKQEEVHNRMVRIASSIDFPTNELESSFTQQKSKFYQIRQQLRSQSLSFIPPMEALSSKTNSSIIEVRHLLSSSSSGGILPKYSPRQNETPDEAIEEVKEDITQQSQLEQENQSQEQNQNLPVIQDILRSNSPDPSVNCQLQFDSENNAEESNSKKVKERSSQQKFQLIELLPAKSVPSRSDHKLIQFHQEDFKENNSLVPKEPKRTNLLYECEINQMSPKYKTLCKVFFQLNNKALLVYKNIKSYIKQPSKPLFIVPTGQIRKVKTYYIQQLSLILPNEQSEASETNDELSLRRSQPVWGLKISLKNTYNNIVKQITDYEESQATPTNRKSYTKNKQLKPSQGSQTNMQEQGEIKHLIFIDEESSRVQIIAKKTKKLIME